MQRKLFFLVLLLLSATSRAQQLPFVYYTPRDGLVNSRVRNTVQDSRGRIFFLTYGGLSVYDGTKFFNYNMQNGLSNDLVNDVLELTPDSFWVAVNDAGVNTLVNGKIHKLTTIDGFYPLINKLIRTEMKDIYAAADGGLFKWQRNKFIQVSIKDKLGKQINYFNNITEYNGWLILTQWVSQEIQHLVAVNLSDNSKQIILNVPASEARKSRSGELWVAFPDGFKILNRDKLKDHLFVFTAPLNFSKANIIQPLGSFCFDQSGEVWINYGNHIMRMGDKGKQLVIADEQGLKSTNVNSIFFDREGIMWLATDGNGVMKLTGTTLQVITNFETSNNSSISYIAANQHSDTVWLYDQLSKSIIADHQSGSAVFRSRVNGPYTMLIKKQHALYFTPGGRDIYKIPNYSDAASYNKPQLIFHSDSGFVSRGIIDPFGNIIEIYNHSNGSFFIHCLIDDRISFFIRIPYLIDQFSFDSHGRLWGATRNNKLMLFELDPMHKDQYLHLLKMFDKELPMVAPRSITVDKNNIVWLGTRHDGLYKLEMDGLTIKKQQQISRKDGLSDNFITTLYCDRENNVWVGTQNGMDKIVTSGGISSIKNITRSQNIFQYVSYISGDRSNNIWALCINGSVIKVAPDKDKISEAKPALFFNELKVNGKEADFVSMNEFPSAINNIMFSVAATSFIDEKLIRYSYLLEGSGNDIWSEPEPTSTFNFINLAPGNYILKVKAIFPDANYAPQIVAHNFIINKPWWQQWWFYLLVGLTAIALIYVAVRIFFKRKLEQQRIIFEKQQAVEQERSRIATDMHDDLGAGLTRIKFLSENIAEKNNSFTDKDDLQKLKGSANELIENMGEIIWAMNEKNNTLEDLLFHLRSYSINYCEENKLGCEFFLPDPITYLVINGHTRRNIFLVVKECLHNIVKHANATNVFLEITIRNGLLINIRDNGKGFDQAFIKTGNGLINMQKRAAEMKGSLGITIENGTRVHFQIPLNV